jgi:CheY-like chemotaxis protein
MRESSPYFDSAKRDMRYKMAKVQVLVVEPHRGTASIIQRLLYTFGFRKITVVANGMEAIRHLRSNRIDLVITEWNTEPGSGLSLIKTIRNARNERLMRPDLPIIMLTAESDKSSVELARDVGITEFLAKPFSARTFSVRLAEAIDKPREFVSAPTYMGPNRRRRGTPPPGEKERRRPRAPVEENVLILPAGSTLLQLMGGVSAGHILSEEVIAEGEATLQNAENEFVAWVLNDVSKLEEAYLLAVERPTASEARKALIDAAYTIQAQSGTFGYPLGTKVGGLLIDYIASHASLGGNAFLVIRKHIDTLSAIFHQRIKDSGSATGEALIDSLSELTARFR